MKLWPFKRKNTASSQLPEEVQEYYASTRNEKTGKAWLFGFGTLVLTAVLAVGLFFGGQWVWRQFDGSDDTQTAETSQTDTDENQITENTDSDTSTDSDQPDTITDDDSSDPDDSAASDTDQDDSEGSEIPGDSTDETPVTGPTGSEIPSTGPGPGGLQ